MIAKVIDIDGEPGIELPKEMIDKLGWKEGTKIKWGVSMNDEIILTRVDTDEA